MAEATASTSQYGTFPSFGNKMPKEGPRYIPMPFDFTTYQIWNVDLMLLQQQGKISTLQGFFIDNSNNTAPVSIQMGLGGQIIKLGAGYQGFVAAIVNNVPKFIVSSTGTNCVIFALNYPNVTAVWNTSP